VPRLSAKATALVITLLVAPTVVLPGVVSCVPDDQVALECQRHVLQVTGAHPNPRGAIGSTV